ncbi:MAG: cytochrome P460 family protein [Chromatiales bacterium]|nr:cytochrome P460 family protein [Chromatiales bacterium]
MDNTTTGRGRLATGAVAAAALLLAGAGCNTLTSKSSGESAKADGEITVPTGYAGWPKFVPTVDKDKAGQVREIYINDTGLKAKRGEAFPSGTVSVMEIYTARKDGSGNLQRDAEGRLVKDKLDKVFVMAKGAGWGQALRAGTVATGDWVYSAYQADGTTPATSDFSKCRGCHVPLASDDYIARYSEHFDTRKN